MTKVLNYFPDTRASWKRHLKIFIPIILGQSLFALNGFVDNFMVGHISQGVTALSAVNSWTNIMIGFIVGVTAAGSIILSQFYYSGHYALAREISRIRFLLSFGMTSILAICAWTQPDALINVFLSGDGGTNHLTALSNARIYLKVIVIQWLLISISGNFGDQFREIGYGYLTMLWGIATLVTNITLNSVLMYGLGMGVDGAAWASVASRIVAIIFAVTFIYSKKIQISFKPWTIFKISQRAWLLFAHRWYVFLSFTTIVFFITMRNFFYDKGYPISENSSLGPGLSAMMVLGLTGAIQNIFTTTFSALSAMAAIFVGAEQGRKNFALAKSNSNRLKGFNTLMAASLSVLLVIVAIIVPWLTFLSSGASDTTYIDHNAHLFQTRNSLFVIAAFYPCWIWFSTSYRNAISGGKGFWFAFSDWVITGPIQLAYLALLMLVVVPTSPFLQGNFAASYALFFLMDFAKLAAMETLYYRYKWLFSLVKETD